MFKKRERNKKEQKQLRHNGEETKGKIQKEKKVVTGKWTLKGSILMYDKKKKLEVKNLP